MGEVWKAIEGYEGIYEVSSVGRVRSLPRITTCKGVPARLKGRVRSQGIDRYGYACVVLNKNGQRQRHKVHRLVCRAFHGPGAPRAHAAHLDHNKLNNVPENLAWVSHSENTKQNVARGILPPLNRMLGERHPQAKLTNEAVREIRSRALAGKEGKAIAAEFGVSRAQVSGIINRRRWSHVV